MTGLTSEGEPCFGIMLDDRKLDYNFEDAKKMICNEGADFFGRILVGSMALDNHLRHYIYVRTLYLKLHNLAQLTEGDIVVMWAFLTGRNIDWANFVRFYMTLAKKDGEALPYASFITRQ